MRISARITSRGQVPTLSRVSSTRFGIGGARLGALDWPLASWPLTAIVRNQVRNQPEDFLAPSPRSPES